MSEGGFNIAEYWPFILMLVMLYLLIIRPQQKRQKEQMQMHAGLSVGDEVATSSGILGRVAAIADNIVTLEIAPEINIKVQRAAVTTLLPKGTLDNPESLPPPPPSCCA
ncbi:MAG: yajC [Burkholderiaceae bacterium]|nr:yajC [Burkholderiaceae bacterium]